MFNDPEMISFYGSWVRVQVAFYDFLFQHALQLCPEHFREQAIESAMDGQFADGEDFYESSVKKIESSLPDFNSAWVLFCKDFAHNKPVEQTPSKADFNKYPVLDWKNPHGTSSR